MKLIVRANKASCFAMELGISDNIGKHDHKYVTPYSVADMWNWFSLPAESTKFGI